tara:strand:- start:2610 stop:3422 length:813 start_codon:yes stop_codon:yes gene_type:complete
MKILLSLSIFFFAHYGISQEKLISVYYDVASHTLSKDQIEKLTPLLHPQVGEAVLLKVESFTDYSGSKSYNKQLSERRTKSVLDILDNLGDSKEIINNGEEYIAEDYTASQYRRVDIYYDIWIEEQAMDAVSHPVQVTRETVSTGLRDDFKEFISDPDAEEMTIVLDILFHGNSDAFINPDDPDLWALFYALRGNETMSVNIRGHVCCGSNMPLSTSRAYAVYNFLKDRGVSPDRMKFKGYDNTIPAVTPELTEYDRAKNRRVDVVFKKQ